MSIEQETENPLVPDASEEPDGRLDEEQIPRRANIGETLSLPVISVDGRGGLLDESTAVQERAGG